jgi:hypothetical protein
MAILPTLQQAYNDSSSSSSQGCWDVDWVAAGDALQAVRAEGFTLAGFRVVSPGLSGLGFGSRESGGSQGSSVGVQQQQQYVLQLAHVLKLSLQQVAAVKKGPLLVLALAKDNAVVRLQACMAAAVQQQQQQRLGRDASSMQRATASLAAVSGCIAALPGSAKAAEQQVVFFFDELTGCGACIV